MFSCGKRLLSFSIVIILFGFTTSLQFTSRPKNVTYANKGSSILLNWNYTTNSGEFVTLMKWYQAHSNGSAIGDYIIYKQILKDPRYNNKDFYGRVSYIPNGAMLIHNVSLTDQGYMAFYMNYFVSASNIILDMVYLKVTIQPTIAAGLKNESIVYEGKESRLECAFDARPTPTIKWYLNDIEMHNIRYSINTTTIGYIGDTIRVQSVLLINSSMPEDSGVISCFAVLPNGNKSSEINHIVKYKPRDTRFIVDKVNVVADLGLSAIFNCTADGSYIIFYQIFKNGVLVRNSTSGIYTLNSVSIADDGAYACSPSNLVGVGTRRELVFNVQVAPSLLESTGSSLKTVVGSQLSLSCTFYGEPTPNITWRKHQNSISNAAIINTTILSKNSSFSVLQSLLILDKASKSDYGLYECMANNIAGFLAQNISVDVQYAPNFNKSLKNNYTLIEDDKKNRSWVCKAEGNPQMIINWLINGKPVMNGFTVVEKKNQLSSNGYEIESTLTMVGINRINAGTLTCNASNVIGSQQSNSKIIIQFKVEFVTPLSPVSHIQQGTQNFKLQCIAIGNPEPTISWLNNGTVMQNNNETDISNALNKKTKGTQTKSTLNFKIIKKKHHGNYTCMASNAIGSISSTSLLEITPQTETTTEKTWVIAVGISIGVFIAILVLLLVLGRLTRKNIDAVTKAPSTCRASKKDEEMKTETSGSVNNAYETIAEHKL